jgi:hypothetical protein
MQLTGEEADLRRRAALAAVHAEGQADDEGADFAGHRELIDLLDRIPLAGVDGGDGVCEDAAVISGGDADAGITVVDAERGVRRSFQSSSGGRRSASFLIASAW